MSLTYYPQSEWQLTTDQAVPEENYLPALIPVLNRRDTWTKVYERPLTYDSDIPPFAVNPGNLETTPSGSSTTIGYWHCIDRGCQRQYGDNGPKMYHETWEKVSAWSVVQ